MKTSFTFRPHHFLCAVGFKGKGYSPEFVANMHNMVKVLRSEAGDEVELRVTTKTDDICNPCPHRRNRLCEDQEKIDQLDSAHAAALKIQEGEVLTWKEAKQRMAANISKETFHRICEPCGWKKFGICEKALKKLKKSKTTKTIGSNPR